MAFMCEMHAETDLNKLRGELLIAAKNSDWRVQMYACRAAQERFLPDDPDLLFDIAASELFPNDRKADPHGAAWTIESLKDLDHYHGKNQLAIASRAASLLAQCVASGNDDTSLFGTESLCAFICAVHLRPEGVIPPGIIAKFKQRIDEWAANGKSEACSPAMGLQSWLNAE
jgi:hypothetical protein